MNQIISAIQIIIPNIRNSNEEKIGEKINGKLDQQETVQYIMALNAFKNCTYRGFIITDMYRQKVKSQDIYIPMYVRNDVKYVKIHSDILLRIYITENNIDFYQPRINVPNTEKLTHVTNDFLSDCHLAPDELSLIQRLNLLTNLYVEYPSIFCARLLCSYLHSCMISEITPTYLHNRIANTIKSINDHHARLENETIDIFAQYLQFTVARDNLEQKIVKYIKLYPQIIVWCAQSTHNPNNKIADNLKYALEFYRMRTSIYNDIGRVRDTVEHLRLLRIFTSFATEKILQKLLQK